MFSAIRNNEPEKKRPMWLTLSVILFSVVIFPLVPIAFYIIFMGDISKWPSCVFFVTVFFTSVGLVGLWRMRLWGVAYLIFGYLPYAALYIFWGVGLQKYPVILLPIIYMPLYVFLKRMLNQNHKVA